MTTPLRPHLPATGIPTWVYAGVQIDGHPIKPPTPPSSIQHYQIEVNYATSRIRAALTAYQLEAKDHPNIRTDSKTSRTEEEAARTKWWALQMGHEVVSANPFPLLHLTPQINRKKETTTMIGRAAVQGMSCRIPALLHEAEMTVGEWQSDSRRAPQWATDWQAFSKSLADHHDTDDQSRRVPTYFDAWWDQPFHDIRRNSGFWGDNDTSRKFHLDQFKRQVGLISTHSKRRHCISN